MFCVYVRKKKKVQIEYYYYYARKWTKNYLEEDSEKKSEICSSVRCHFRFHSHCCQFIFEIISSCYLLTFAISVMVFALSISFLWSIFTFRKLVSTRERKKNGKSNNFPHLFLCFLLFLQKLENIFFSYLNSKLTHKLLIEIFVDVFEHVLDLHVLPISCACRWAKFL